MLFKVVENWKDRSIEEYLVASEGGECSGEELYTLRYMRDRDPLSALKDAEVHPIKLYRKIRRTNQFAIAAVNECQLSIGLNQTYFFKEINVKRVCSVIMAT
jgi:hypothetical protein